MVHIKNKLLLTTNSFLSFLLSLLGFYGCSSEGPDMYGQPYATFQINGNVTDAQEKPLEQKRIIVRNLNYGEEGAYRMSDTLLTDKEGAYLWKRVIYNHEGKLRVVCQDPTKQFKADSTEVDIKLTEKGKGSWNMGSGSQTVNFQLQENNE
ncbi:MAG: radical SAM-associated putative lipoprotein [Bacteroidaceae bacterium]|nr:radical SAM-associated putative lipoprotein [Bacteroidaceae bacterium]